MRKLSEYSTLCIFTYKMCKGILSPAINYFKKLNPNSNIVSQNFYRQLFNSLDLTHTFYEFSKDFPVSLKSEFSSHFTIYPDYISISEEESLLAEIEPIVKRMRYEFDHWDNAIQGFREIQRLHSSWKHHSINILERLQSDVFKGLQILPHAHILDLHETGHIKPHIDSTRFCGEIISGLNLLSPAVMRLQYGSSFYCDVLVSRRSMYAMKGPARYEFTHEILPPEKSKFRGSDVKRKRRISVLLRCEPNE